MVSRECRKFSENAWNLALFLLQVMFYLQISLLFPVLKTTLKFTNLMRRGESGREESDRDRKGLSLRA